MSQRFQQSKERSRGRGIIATAPDRAIKIVAARGMGISQFARLINRYRIERGPQQMARFNLTG